MKILGMSGLALALLWLSACEKEVEPEIEVRIDEEKLGRAIGKHLINETEKAVGETIVMKEQEIDMTLPRSASDQDAGSVAAILELTAIRVNLRIIH